MRRVFCLASCTLSVLLGGCALSDHYHLMSDNVTAPDAAAGTGGGAGAFAALLGGSDGGRESPAGGGGGAGATESAAGTSAGQAAAGALAATAGASGASAGCSCNVGRSCSPNGCVGGWVAAKAPPTGFVARSRAASTAMDKKVFIWGGQDAAGNALDNGAIYTPASDSWQLLPRDTGAPSARIMATALWTGRLVIVYGGTDAGGNNVFRDGASYDQQMNSWSPLPRNSSTSPRSAPFAFWDGARATFWGGLNASSTGVPGADRYDLKAFSVSSSSGDPGPLINPALAFDGSVIYMQGGWIPPNNQDKVYSYTPAADKWAALEKSLSPRSGAFGAWDGARFVVWGGRGDNGLLGDGKALLGTTWTPLPTFGAPSPRYSAFRRSGWSFSVASGVIAIVGGQVSLSGGGTLATNGATFDGSQWTQISSWPSNEAHEFGMGVWTGEEFLVWGGRDVNGPTSTGERWSP